jgi:hypothetical protein
MMVKFEFKALEKFAKKSGPELQVTPKYVFTQKNLKLNFINSKNPIFTYYFFILSNSNSLILSARLLCNTILS